MTKHPRFLILFFLSALPGYAASLLVGRFQLAAGQQVVGGPVFVEGCDALPFFASEINASNESQRIQRVFGMSLTASREAVPILMDLLQSSDEEIRQVAKISLERLTHRAATSDAVFSLDRAWLHETWQARWTSDSAAALIHAYNECGEKLRID